MAETELSTGDGLRKEYIGLCYSLGKDKEAESMPKSRGDLVKKIQELKFEWLHEYHIQ